MSEHPFDAISDVALRAWETTLPESYLDCESRVSAILDEYGELGAMMMIRALSSTPAQSGLKD